MNNFSSSTQRMLKCNIFTIISRSIFWSPVTDHFGQVFRNIFTSYLQYVFKIRLLGSDLIIIVEVVFLDIVKKFEAGRVKLINVIFLVDLIKLMTCSELLVCDNKVKCFETSLGFNSFHRSFAGQFIRIVYHLSNMWRHVFKNWIVTD